MKFRIAILAGSMLAAIQPHVALAQNAPPVQAPAQVLAVAAPVPTASGANDPDAAPPTMLRDARLDELLAAHRQAAGMSSLGGASGFLRNATFEGHGR